MAEEEKKMTYGEIVGLFGGEIPMEAYELLFGPGNEGMTLAEGRRRIQEMALRHAAQATEGHEDDTTWRIGTRLAQQYGGHWGEHPNYPVDDWRYEVDNRDTRLGYWEWVGKKINMHLEAEHGPA